MDSLFTNSFFKRVAKRLILAWNKPFVPKKRPLPMKPPMRKSTSGFSTASRNRRKIRNAAGTTTLLWLTYRKTTDGTTHTYVVEPYSFRYRRLKVGIRKMFYGFDIADGHIKSFAIKNILSARNMKDKYRPRFKVEIAQTVEDLYG